MITGITFSGKHSYKDYDLTIASRKINTPEKRKITKNVPYMNGDYDFSLLYGDQCYDEREVEYTFNLIADSRIALNYRKTEIINWLMNSSKEKLYDDEFPGYYLLAECINSENELLKNDSTITCKFKCYPFFISDDYVGNDLWDPFNFEMDYATQNAFVVNGTSSVNIYNPGALNISPQVICSGDMKVVKGGTNYFFKAGVTTDYRFKLGKGLNNLVITGNGKIEFKFRRETL